MGLIQAWVSRFAMNPDGISYLDIGDGFWRGNLQMLLNGYWSPNQDHSMLTAMIAVDNLVAAHR